MADINDFVQDFLEECREGLERLETEIVELERLPNDPVRLDRIFRILHTIKGNCGFLDFPRLGALAHAGETLLVRMREGKLLLNSEVADHLLQLIDAIRRFLREISATGKEGAEHNVALRESLLRLANSGSAKEIEAPQPPAKAAREDAGGIPPAASPGRSEEKGAAQHRVQSNARQELPVTVEKTAFVTPAIPQKPRPQDQVTSESDSGKQVRSSESSIFSGELSPTSIRIEVGLLDRLMNLIGELVLTRNQLVQHVARLTDPTMTLMAQRLNLITSELQEGFMRTRMLRIGTMWKRFPRVVRDTAQQSGKNVRLVTEGETTELDRSLIEAIADPLTHTIRNAIDHGIERPHERRSCGKPEQGTLTLRAYHEGGQVHIDVSDDGAGVDIDKVRTKALQLGIISAEESMLFSDSQLVNSIFLPGFTTADKLSSLSGRGVGMDVVKTCIEQAGGTVQINSVRGQGTTVRMTVPLTLAIIPALIVRSGNQQFAVPQVGLNELLRLTADEARQRIEVVQDSPTLRLRGRLLPLVRLSEVLRVMPGEAPAAEEICILVLRTGNGAFGLIVDAVTNNEEIVVKPLLPLLQGLSVYSGSTLLGDGSLALILDVLGLSRQSGVFESATNIAAADLSPTASSVQIDLSSGLLLCDVGSGRRVAFPISNVRRLEEIPEDRIEQAGHRSVVQYRDDILPLLDVAAVLYPQAIVPWDSETRKWPVVICGTDSGEIGCRVRRVLDIAVVPSRILPSNVAGLSGSATIDGHVTDLLDVPGLSVLANELAGDFSHG